MNILTPPPPCLWKLAPHALWIPKFVKPLSFKISVFLEYNVFPASDFFKILFFPFYWKTAKKNSEKKCILTTSDLCCFAVLCILQASKGRWMFWIRAWVLGCSEKSKMVIKYFYFIVMPVQINSQLSLYIRQLTIWVNRIWSLDVEIFILMN